MRAIRHTHLAALALLNPEVEAIVLSVVATVPVDLLGGNVANVDGEPGTALVGEVTLGVDTEAIHVSVLWDGTGVRNGEGDGSHVVLDDIEVLEGGGDAVLGGEGDHAIGSGAEDEDLLAVGSVAADVDVLCSI
jgi:hypothetical protein